MQRIISKSIVLTEFALTLARFWAQDSARKRQSVPDNAARQALTWLTIAVLALCSLAFITVGAHNALLPTGSHDLQWTPAKDLLAGVNPYADFLQWKADGNELTPPHFLNQAPSYPASVYVMLAPLGLLDWGIAKLSWLMLNLAFIGAIIAGLQRQFPVKRPLLLTIIIIGFLCSTPVRASLGAGQMNLLSIAAFIWAYDFARRKGSLNQGISGTLLAIAWAKYSLTFPLTIIFISQKNWRPIAAAAFIHLALTIVASIQLGLPPQDFFFSSVSVVLMGSGTGFINISALAMILHLPTSVTMAAIMFALVGTTCLVSKLKDVQPLALMSFLAMISFALFYHHNYDFVVLIFLVWCVATERLSTTATATSLVLIYFSWNGLWLANEIYTIIPTAVHLVGLVEFLQILSFYIALVLVAANLQWSAPGKDKITDSVLAF